jgi:hypothetical protein
MYSTVKGVDGKETIANVVAFLSQILRGYYSDGPYILPDAIPQYARQVGSGGPLRRDWIDLSV